MSSGASGLQVILIGIPAAIIGLVMMVKPRAMLRFRSPGTIERGSIPDWKVKVWQISGATLALLALGLILGLVTL